jgi:hypothetical protein
MDIQKHSWLHMLSMAYRVRAVALGAVGALGLAASALPSVALAQQNLYRCGNTYQQTPCPGDAKSQPRIVDNRSQSPVGGASGTTSRREAKPLSVPPGNRVPTTVATTASDSTIEGQCAALMGDLEVAEQSTSDAGKKKKVALEAQRKKIGCK